MISESVLDSLVAALDVRSRHGATELAPIAVLWPDETWQWQPIIGLVRDRRLVLELGDYDADALRGPAYWIRGILDGEIIVPIPTAGAVPIVYLPGYARSDIRAVEEADARMKP